MIKYFLISKKNNFSGKIPVLSLIIFLGVICVFFLVGCQEKAHNKQPEKPVLKEVKITEAESLEKRTSVKSKNTNKIKIIKVTYSLRWNGKFFNGKAVYQIKSEAKSKRINLLHDPGIRIHTVDHGIIGERKSGLTVINEIKGKIKRLKVEFGLKVYKKGGVDRAASLKSGYVFVSAQLLPLPSTIEFVNKASLPGEFKYELNYDAKKWSLHLPGLEKANISTKTEWIRSGPSLEMVLFKGNSAKMNLEKIEIEAVDGKNQAAALKKIKNYLEVRAKCKQVLARFPLNNEFILFRKKQNKGNSGFSLYILPPSPTCADILRAKLNKNLPVCLSSEGFGSKHLQAALLCHNLGKLDHKKGVSCLNNFKQQYLKLNFGSQKLPSSHKAEDAQKILKLSGLLQWNCQQTFCPRIQEKLQGLKYIYQPSQLLELLNLNKIFSAEIFEKNLFIKAKINSVIKKKVGVEIKIKNQGDLSWAVPLVYKSTRNKITRLVQLPAPGKIKSFSLSVEGRPLNADLDPNDITLMLPFGWTRKGPPVEPEPENQKTDHR